MAGVKFNSYLRSTKMSKPVDDYSNESWVGFKHYVKVLTGEFQIYVQGITKKKEHKVVSTSAGESPVSTDLGRQPETIQVVGVPRSLSSTKKLHSFDAIFELLYSMWYKRDSIDPTVVLIGSISNLFIPGMVLEVTDSTEYLYFPTHTRWIIQDVQTDRNVTSNRTYIQFTWTLTEWPSKNPDNTYFRYVEDEYRCPNCPGPGE